MTPREQIIAAAQKNADTVRKSAASDIATAEEISRAIRRRDCGRHVCLKIGTRFPISIEASPSL